MQKLGVAAMYVLTLGGFAVMMSAFMQTMGRVMYRDARNMIVNTLRTDPRRAHIICSRETNTFFDAIGAAMKTAAMTKTRDLTIIMAASRPAYDAACMMLALRWKKLVGRGKAGLVMAGAGIALAIKNGSAPLIVIIFAGLTALGFLWIFVHKLEVDRSLVLARQEVLPEVDRAYAEGRYAG